MCKAARKLQFLGDKRVLMYLLALSLLLGCAGKTPAPEPPPSLTNLSAPAEAETASQQTVTAERLNVRETPSGSGRMTGVLFRGDMVDIKEQKKHWVRVVGRDDIEGWVYAPGNLTGFPALAKKKRVVREATAPSTQRKSQSPPENEEPGEYSQGAEEEMDAPDAELSLPAHTERSTTDEQAGDSHPASSKHGTGAIANDAAPVENDTVFVEIVPASDPTDGSAPTPSENDSSLQPAVSGPVPPASNRATKLP